MNKYKLLAIVSCLFLIGLLGYSIWGMPTPKAPVDLRPVTVLADCPDDAGVKLSASPKFASLNGTVVDPLVFASGTAGTYTVTRGYVVALSAVASTVTDAGGGADAGDSGIVGATVTITPNGPGITDGSAVTQPPILIPSAGTWSVSRPAIQGSANEMGVGTVIIFNGTIAYTVVMSLGGT